MEKDGAGASAALPPRAIPSEQGLKSRPGVCEKSPARVDTPVKKVMWEPSGQFDEEEEEP